MSMQSYPVVVDGALFIDERLAACILIANEQKAGVNLPDDIQALIDNNELEKFIDKLTDDDTDVDGRPNPLAEGGYDDVGYAAEIIDRQDNSCYCGCYDGDVETMNEIDIPDDKRINNSYDSATLVYLIPEHSASLFRKDAPYEDVNALVEEYKRRMQGLLPDDFDLRPYVVNICGTNFS